MTAHTDDELLIPKTAKVRHFVENPQTTIDDAAREAQDYCTENGLIITRDVAAWDVMVTVRVPYAEKPMMSDTAAWKDIDARTNERILGESENFILENQEVDDG